MFLFLIILCSIRIGSTGQALPTRATTITEPYNLANLTLFTKSKKTEKNLFEK